MERWRGRVAVVTGASSGIGAAIVLDLCRAGIITVGLARRVERIEQLRAQLDSDTQRALLHARHCDVASEADIRAAFAWVEQQLGGCDILVNNAGTLRPGRLLDEDNTQAIDATIAVNLRAVVLCTREAFRSMQRRTDGPNQNGHVVLINSVIGHRVPFLPQVFGEFNVNTPTKFAVTATTEVLRQEFQAKRANVKVTVCAYVDILYVD